jgi:peptide/nickel transport system ATP-binding protein
MGIGSRGRRQGPELAQAPTAGDELLRIEGLKVEFESDAGRTYAVRGLSVSLHAGRIVGVAGESGSGKTTSALAAMGLLAPGATVAGSIRYGHVDLLSLTEKELRQYRGRHLGMIFQETATALNPVMRVGDQLTMATRAHLNGGRAEIRGRVIAALREVRLTDVDRVMASYPHELSGGQCQRVMIAMALSCGSRVLFADEPTSALDVSVQEEILGLIRDLVAERQLAVMMISHDLAVLADICDELVVMYKGEIVEAGPVATVLGRPCHPYTKALIDCLPKLHGDKEALPELPPSTFAEDGSDGCRFRDRCGFAIDLCAQTPSLEPVTGDNRRRARCWRSAELLSIGPGNQLPDAPAPLMTPHGSLVGARTHRPPRDDA